MGHKYSVTIEKTAFKRLGGISSSCGNMHTITIDAALLPRAMVHTLFAQVFHIIFIYTFSCEIFNEEEEDKLAEWLYCFFRDNERLFVGKPGSLKICGTEWPIEEMNGVEDNNGETRIQEQRLAIQANLPEMEWRSTVIHELTHLAFSYAGIKTSERDVGIVGRFIDYVFIENGHEWLFADINLLEKEA